VTTATAARLSLKSGETTLARPANVGEAENVTNTYITNELYVNYGWIADLAVNRLRTDFDRARRYQMSSTAPLHYLDMHDEVIRFVSATTDGSSHSQLSFDGRLYWWTEQAAAASPPEGHPFPPLPTTIRADEACLQFREVELYGGGSWSCPCRLGPAPARARTQGLSTRYERLRLKYFTESEARRLAGA
jgi:hypothetical protein